MKRKTSNTNRNNYSQKDYFFKKIKSISKKDNKKSDFNKDLFHYNNSIEIDKKIDKKINKDTKLYSININEPILSERTNRNYSNGNKKGIDVEFMKLYKRKTADLIPLNSIGINQPMSPPFNGKTLSSGVKSFFDENFLNNYNNKINNDKNIKTIQSSQHLLPVEKESDKIHVNSKPKTGTDYSKKRYKYFQQKKNKTKNNLNLNMSDPTHNNYNFKSYKNLNNSKKEFLLKENESLKAELNKFVTENLNLKIKINSLQNKGINYDLNNTNKNNISNYYNKKNAKNKTYDKLEENSEDSTYIKTNNIIANKFLYNNNDKKKYNTVFNSIYDSMKFKIKAKAINNSISNHMNNMDNINFSNSLNNNKEDMNYNKLSLTKGYHRNNDLKYCLGKSIENLKISKNILNNSNINISDANIKYNGAEIGNINYNNNSIYDINILKEKISNLQRENEELKKENADYKINSLVKNKNVKTN